MQNRPKKEIVITQGKEMFCIDDVVSITIAGADKTKYSGRLIMIGENEFSLDMSDKYKSSTRRFSYENIASISRFEE